MNKFLTTATATATVLVMTAAIVLDASAQSKSSGPVRDSVKVQLIVKAVKSLSGPNDIYKNCGAILYGIWKDKRKRIEGEGRAARYGAYSFFNPPKSAGNEFETGFGRLESTEKYDLIIPDDKLAFQWGGSGQQGGAWGSGCNRYPSLYGSFLPALGEVYAYYKIDDGTVVALMEAEQLAGLSVFFDGSFASDLSFEIQDGVKKAPVKYDWVLSDGFTSSARGFTHVFPSPGSYTATLTVTDDDAEMDSVTQTIDVTGVVLSYKLTTDSGVFVEQEDVAARIEVTNTGTEDAVNVSVPKLVNFDFTFPDNSPKPDEYKFVNYAALNTADFENEVFSLAVGESQIVDVKYTVESVANHSVRGQKFSVGSDVSTSIYGAISGENILGDAAVVVDACTPVTCNSEFKLTPVFTSTIIIDRDKVRFSNIFDVKIDVTNNGDATIAGVQIHPGGPEVRKAELPSFVGINSGPPDLIVSDGPHPAAIVFLSPGQTKTFALKMTVKDLAKWWLPSDGSFQDVPSVVYMMPSQVTGNYKSTSIIAGCRLGYCDDRLEVTAAPYDIEMEIFTSDGSSEFKAGLNKRKTLPEVSQIADPTGDSGDDPICATGCIDIKLTVSTEDGEVLENDVDVDLSVGPFPAKPDVQGGRFLCTREKFGEDMTCVDEPGPLVLTTDSEGVAKAWYAMPGIIEPQDLSIHVEIPISSTISTEVDSTIKIQPNVVIDNKVNPSTEKLLAGKTFANLASSLRFVSIGFWCGKFASFISDTALNAADFSRLQTYWVKTSMGTVIGAICNFAGVLLGVGAPLATALAGSADAAQKISALTTVLWFSQVYGVPYPDRLVNVAPVAGFPPVWIEGDYLGVVSDVIGIGGFAARPKPGPRRLIVTEMTGMSKWEAGTDQVFYFNSVLNIFDSQYLHFEFSGPDGNYKKLISFGYNTEWLVEEDKGRTVVGEMSRTFLILEGIAGMVDAGDYVQIDEGQRAEVLQVSSVETAPGKAGGSAELTVHFTSPIRFDHTDGMFLSVIGPGKVGPPEPPILELNIDVRPDTLRWATNPISIATSYDVEMASDSLFTDLLLSETEITENYLPLPENLVQIGSRYFWRARAYDLTGVGPWSGPQSFTPTTAVAIEEDGQFDVPSSFKVNSPFPNPSNSQSVLMIELPNRGALRVDLFDMLGRRIRNVMADELAAGTHSISLDVTSLPSGIYHARAIFEGRIESKKITVVR